MVLKPDPNTLAYGAVGPTRPTLKNQRLWGIPPMAISSSVLVGTNFAPALVCRLLRKRRSANPESSPPEVRDFLYLIPNPNTGPRTYELKPAVRRASQEKENTCTSVTSTSIDAVNEFQWGIIDTLYSYCEAAKFGC